MAKGRYVIFGARRRRAFDARMTELLACAMMLLALSVIACAFARSWWVFDLASHFRPHYLVGALAAAGLALILRRPRAFALIALLALPHFMVVEPWQGLKTALARAGHERPGEPVSLKVMTVNVNWANEKRAAVLREIDETDPDLLFIQEADDNWFREVAALTQRFPHRASAGPLYHSGIHIYSRFPITGSRTVQPPGLYYRYLIADLQVEGKALRAVSVHAPNPLGPNPRDTRNRYLRHLASSLGKSETPTIVAGDFNITRWSPFYEDLVVATGLASAAEDNSWQATWPSWVPFGRIAIDHILVSDRIAVRGHTRGPDVGSDHLPVIAELDLL